MLRRTNSDRRTQTDWWRKISRGCSHHHRNRLSTAVRNAVRAAVRVAVRTAVRATVRGCPGRCPGRCPGHCPGRCRAAVRPLSGTLPTRAVPLAAGRCHVGRLRVEAVLRLHVEPARDAVVQVQLPHVDVHLVGRAGRGTYHQRWGNKGEPGNLVGRYAFATQNRVIRNALFIMNFCLILLLTLLSTFIG